MPCSAAVKVAKLKSQFRYHERGPNLSGVTVAMLDCFALLYAGGRLAIGSGVLPWKEWQLRAGLHECLVAALKHQRAGQLTRKVIRHTLRQQLRTSSLAERDAGCSFGPDEHAGFYDVVDGRRQYTIHATIFRRWFGNSARSSAALMWLHAQGLLVMREKHLAVPSPTSTEWAERTPRWPDGRLQKSFVFYDLPRPPRATLSMASRARKPR
jgi:hypothetical protein